MAEAKKARKTKKSRIRKAPTLREQTESARVKSEVRKPSQVRKLASKANRALKKTRLTRNPLTAFLAKIGRIILKVLRWLIPSYFIKSWREVRLVTWPNRRETRRLMITVIIFAVIFGALVTSVDKVLDIIFKEIVLG